jgi:hypothetical protein
MVRMDRMSRRSKGAWLAAILLAAAAAAGTASHAVEPDYASRIGIFYKCLSIRNPGLTPGTPVAILGFTSKGSNFVLGDTPDGRFAGKIVAKTRSAQDCLSEVEERNYLYESDEFTLYTVAPTVAGAFKFFEIGIAVVGIGPNDASPIDLDGKGDPDYFALSPGEASLTFEVQSGDPTKGEPVDPLWTGRYVFGVGAVRIPPPLGARVGWISDCLVIQNHGLQPGTPLTIMTIGDLDRFSVDRVLDLRLTGKIVEKTSSEKTCNLLADDRRAVMDPDNVSFYTVALDDGPFMNPEEELFGIAVVGPPPPGAFDFDGNGSADSFTACQYYEGFGFDVWSGEPYAGEPSWSDYYYLGYESEEIDCPVTAPNDDPELYEPTSEWLPVFRLGWIFGGCLATSNEKLKPGTPIGIVTRDGAEKGSGVLKKRILAKVLGRGGTGEDCPGLSPQLREWNQMRGVPFYPVGLENGQPLDPHMFGVGIILPPEDQALDLDGKGQPDGFSVCHGERGNMNFLAWVGEPVIGGTAEEKALSGDAVAGQLTWSGHLYIDRRSAGVPDCPAGFW